MERACTFDADADVPASPPRAPAASAGPPAAPAAPAAGPPADSDDSDGTPPPARVAYLVAQCYKRELPDPAAIAPAPTASRETLGIRTDDERPVMGMLTDAIDEAFDRAEGVYEPVAPAVGELPVFNGPAFREDLSMAIGEAGTHVGENEAAVARAIASLKECLVDAPAASHEMLAALAARITTALPTHRIYASHLCIGVATGGLDEWALKYIPARATVVGFLDIKPDSVYLVAPLSALLDGFALYLADEMELGVGSFAAAIVRSAVFSDFDAPAELGDVEVWVHSNHVFAKRDDGKLAVLRVEDLLVEMVHYWSFVEAMKADAGYAERPAWMSKVIYEDVPKILLRTRARLARSGTAVGGAAGGAAE